MATINQIQKGDSGIALITQGGYFNDSLNFAAPARGFHGFECFNAYQKSATGTYKSDPASGELALKKDSSNSVQ